MDGYGSCDSTVGPDAHGEFYVVCISIISYSQIAFFSFLPHYEMAACLLYTFSFGQNYIITCGRVSVINSCLPTFQSRNIVMEDFRWNMHN
jgi:hypothetical protein